VSGRPRTVGSVEILQLPEAMTPPPALLWSVLARNLGEQGAAGRTALAWRWALTGAFPSPVTLTTATGRVPSREEILIEAAAPAELARSESDPGGQVMQARFALEWMSGKIDALPLWNGGAQELPVTDSAAFPLAWGQMEATYFWALLAQRHCHRAHDSAPGESGLASGWACGVMDLLAWVCGEAGEGPLSGRRVLGRPTLYEVSLDACRAVAGVQMAREAGDLVRARRMEAVMETFLWLAGWSQLPPVDRHGHGSFEDCPDRDAPCGCDAAGRCLGQGCKACSRFACVHGFGQEAQHATAEATSGDDPRERPGQQLAERGLPRYRIGHQAGRILPASYRGDHEVAPDGNLDVRGETRHRVRVREYSLQSFDVGERDRRQRR